MDEIFTFKSCLEKQQIIINLFKNCIDDEERYNKIIQFGKNQLKLLDQYKTPDNIVQGCQSIMYLRTYLKDGKLFFETYSDALISSGLASLLIRVYEGETPEVVLKCPPDYLEQLGLKAALTPGRANGLYSIHLKMKQDALNALIYPNRFLSK